MAKRERVFAGAMLVYDCAACEGTTTCFPCLCSGMGLWGLCVKEFVSWSPACV